jgi:hypothetical protein
MNATLAKLLGGGATSTVAALTGNSSVMLVLAMVLLLPAMASAARSMTITVLGGWMAICGSRTKEAQLHRVIATLNRSPDPADTPTEP